MRSNPDQLAFSAGEISPLLYGRTDYQRVQAGLRACRGFLPLRQGGVTRAPGTVYRGRTRADSRARLIAFEFAVDDAVVLEFTLNRMRVWRYGELVTAAGEPYMLVTPYHEDVLDRLQWVQSADVIYMTDGLQRPQRLARRALNDWTISPVSFREGPFEVENDDEAVTIRASGETGAITLTATGGPFVAAHVGSLVQLRAIDDETVATWVAEKDVTLGERLRYDGRIYEVVSGASTGTNPPTHTEGKVWVGRGCPIWRYVADRIGIVRITGVTDANTATANVVRHVPPAIVAAATYRWAEGAWSDKNGYPAAIEIHDQRLALACTPRSPRTLWFSAVGDYRHFRPGVEADDSFAYTISGRSSLNRICWLQSGARGLHIGALGEEYSTRTDSGQAIGPTNFGVGLDSTIGVSPAMPEAPDGRPLFISRDRRRLFEMRFSFEADASQAVELSLPAEHLGLAGLAEVAWQSSQRLGWVRRDDGTVALVLADAAEDVLGWAVWSCAGGFVESIAVSRDATGAREHVYMVIRRTIQGQERRHVERVGDIVDMLAGGPDVDVMHLFALNRRSGTEGAPITILSELAYLEGETVHVWTDLGAMGPYVVTGGSVTLDAPVTRAYVGLFDDTHMIETLDVLAPVREGSGLGRQKRVKGLGLRWHRTARAQTQMVEREFGQADVVSPWQESAAFHVASDNAAALSGVQNLPAPTGWAREVTLRVRPVGGAPLTLLSAAALVEAAGG